MSIQSDEFIGLVPDRRLTEQADSAQVIAQFMRGLTTGGPSDDGGDDIVRRAWREAAAEGR